MARLMCGGLVLMLGIAAGAAVGADAPVRLRETAKAGATTRVLIALKADGVFRPGSSPGVTKAQPAKPLALRVETQLEFGERLAKVDATGRVRRAVRRVVKASSAINGEVRPSAAVLRPEVALLVAEPRPDGVIVYSPGGPLTRPELELVQGVGDPLALAALLPDRPVAVGGRWRVGDEAVRGLTAYDTITSSGLEAVLESLDDRWAEVRLAGEVRGSVLGGDGTMTCQGTYTFDRREGRVRALTLRRTESRKPGPVEAGLEMKSTLTVTRTGIATPLELSDSVLSGLPTDPDPGREALLLVASGGKFTLRHDRDWHTYWDDRRLTVLKRLERGTVVAQCNLSIGPNAGRGRHQDLAQFRDDLRRALGKRLDEFLGEGEVDGDPAGGFRYRVGVQGREGELGVVWYYYLVAGPEGDQLLATFTLARDQAKPFGDQDLRMIGSLRWKDEPATPAKP